ncbi:UN13D protein, partial [Leiothrix lutea]|nr:UN13D protein [Leiothrix lutea]
RIFKDARKDKGQDDFLGNVVVRLKDLHCWNDQWYQLEPRTETYPERGHCHLQFLLTHKKRATTSSRTQPSYTVHRHLLQQLVSHEILQHQVPQGCFQQLQQLGWGKASLLYLHATQKDLSDFHQDMAQWLAYSKLYQSLEFNSSCLLHQITSIEYRWVQERLRPEQKAELAESFQSLLTYGVSLVRRFRIIFPLSVPRSTERLQSLLRVLVQMCKTKAFHELCTPSPDLPQMVSTALKVLGVSPTPAPAGWDPVGLPFLPSPAHCPRLSKSTRITMAWEIPTPLQPAGPSLNLKLNIFSIAYLELESLVAEHVQEQLHKVDSSMSKPTAESLFDLYRKLQELYQMKDSLPNRDGPLALSNFHQWFEEALPLWLQKAYTTTLERAQRAIQMDQVRWGGETSLLPLGTLQLSSRPCCCAWLSTDTTTQVPLALQEQPGPSPRQTKHVIPWASRSHPPWPLTMSLCPFPHFSLAAHLCIVVNNIEQLRLLMLRLPSQLDWAQLEQRMRGVIDPQQIQNALHNQLDSTVACLDHEVRDVVQALATKLEKGIARHIQELSSSSDTQKPEDSIIPLMKFLESELQYLNEHLVQENFKSLELCFHAEGCGLPLETLHSATFQTLETHLALCSASSRKLIQKYFSNRIQQQLDTSSEKYGAVTIKALYRPSEQKLRVEVLNATNLIPLDSNGSSDPFVQLTLEPRHEFAEVVARTTQCKRNELHPLFDEAFEFLIPSEKCRQEGACLLLTVFDYDVLGANDLEGEAFFPLCHLPGLDTEEDEADMGRVPQTRLPLTHPKPTDEILKLLESRKRDKEAQAFVKLRKQRAKQSKET